MQRRLTDSPVLLLLAPALFLMGIAFCTSLPGEFVWDDVMQVRDNAALYRFDGAPELLTSDLWGQATGTSTQLYHPVPMLSLWLQGVVHGPSLIGFRIGNLLCHLGVVWLLYAWLKRLHCETKTARLLAWIFAVHPLVTEPVMWITGRHDLLGAIFTLLAALAWPTSREHFGKKAALATVAVGLAFASKEPYVIAPGVVFLGTAVHALRDAKASSSLGRWGRALGNAGLTLVTALGVGAVFLIRHKLGISAGASALHANLSEHLQHAIAIFGHYASLGLTLRNGSTFHLISPPSTADFLLAVLLSAWFVLGLIKGRKDVRWLRASVGVALFAGAAAPHLISVPTIGMYGNRYGYLPLIGLLTATSPALEWMKARLESVIRPQVGLVVLGLSLLGVSVQSAVEASRWADAETLYLAAVVEEPENGIARFHLGHARRVAYGCRLALQDFERAWELAPAYERAPHNFAGCLLREKRPAEAISPARAALALSPHDASRHFNLASALAATGSLEPAYAHARRATELAPKKKNAVALAGKLERALANREQGRR